MNLIIKILTTSSLILNSFLLIYLFGLVPFLLFLTSVANLGLVSYIIYLLKERNGFQDDFFQLLSNLEIYSSKLMKTYELEMFYGDDTLEDLIRSSKVLINNFYDYEEKYFTINEAVEDGNEDKTTDIEDDDRQDN